MWLRLTRRGERLTGEWSAGGKAWARTSEERVPNLPGMVTVGALTTRNAEVAFTAAFDKYELTPLPAVER